MADKIHRRKGSKKSLRSARDRANGKYVRQRNRTEMNRYRRRLKHFLLYPNDLQTAALIKVGANWVDKSL